MRFSPKALAVLALSGLALLAPAAAAKSPVDWSDLPWADLEASLSPSANLLQTTNSDYAAQCYPEFQTDRLVRSQHNLVDQPSGLCMNHLYCAYERCNPLPLTGAEAAKTTVVERWNAILVDQMSVEIPDPTWLDASNPAYNLPSTVLFPSVAGDISAAVSFAVRNGIGVSVKNSGHSYTGASTKRDTLHLNMNRYAAYSAGGVEECTDVGGGPYLADLADQPCRLARARDKPAVLRVGGGENFGEVYTSVKTFNEAQEGGYKYHLVGGAAGTVSPMGWTWQGGLAGTTGGRKYGFGVDQVIRVDMVLPDGRHVRFGPTEWADPDEGYTVPRTKTVSGVCHANPEEPDEARWVWEECESEGDSININFDDLWFAVLGGGGGTWGVVTSVILQLHEYEPLEAVSNGIDTIMGCGLPDEHRDIVEKEWWNFYIEFMFDPQAVGVTEEESANCASSTYNYLLCYGEGSANPYMEAWTRYIGSRNQTFTEAGIPTETINLVAACPGTLLQHKDYADLIIIKEGPNKGKARDSPSPAYVSTTETDVNLLMPAKYILENRDAAREMILANEQAPYCAFGGRAGFAQDGANSLSQAHRLGGWMLMLSLEILTESFYSEEFPKMFDTTDGGNFPGFIGGNHAGPNMRGPLKDDWTQPCPLDWTQQERDDKCFSLQESLWGTKTLSRLEMIKESIDPDFVFDCYGCVSNNRDPAAGGAPEYPKKQGGGGELCNNPNQCALCLVLCASGGVGTYDKRKSDFDILRELAIFAGLVDALGELNDVTLFLPPDRAFYQLAEALGYEEKYDEKKIYDFFTTTLGETTIQQVILYHVGIGVLSAEDLIENLPTIETADPDGGTIDVKYQKSSGKMRVILKPVNTQLNRPRVHKTKYNLETTQGLVHVITKVLVPFNVNV